MLEGKLRDELDSIHPSGSFGALVERRIGVFESRRRATKRLGVVTVVAILVALVAFVGSADSRDIDVATNPPENRDSAPPDSDPRPADSPRSSTTSATSTSEVGPVDASPGVPTLLSPPPDAEVQQSDPNTGCEYSDTHGYGYRIDFAWTDVEATDGYALALLHKADPTPVTVVEVDESEYPRVVCNAYVIEQNRNDWFWKVRAKKDNGQWGPWSDERRFSYSPLPDDGTCWSCPSPTVPDDAAPKGDLVRDPVVNIGETVTLDGGADDAGRHRWDLASIPSQSGASLSNPEGDQPTFVVDVEGVYLVRHWVEGRSSEGSGDVVVVAAIPGAGRTVLVDASKGGGGWWFPQAGPVFDPSSNHQGKALADHLRSMSFVVIELPRSTPSIRIEISATLLSGFDTVVRAGDYLPTSTSEIDAYHLFVEDGGSLLLTADHQPPGDVDALALSFGVRMEGVTRGEDVIDTYAQHPVTEGVGPVRNGVGSGITSWPESTQVVGSLSEATYLDLDNDQIQDPDEPTGVPALAVSSRGSGRILFSGDLNVWQFLPQPLLDNTVDWLFH